MEKRSGKGNPNPSPETRFGAGGNANPAGKTSAQRQAEYRKNELSAQAGAMAAQIQVQMLEALQQHVSANPAAALAAIATDPLKLIKDAMDREFGTAVQKIDNTSSDGTMSPKPGLDVSKLSTEALAEIMRAADDTRSSND